MDRWTRRSFVVAGLCLGGCARFERPPLGVLYRPTHANADQPPLVVIPGAFGSSLRDRQTGREVWPGSAAELLTGDYRSLEVEIDPVTLEPQAGDIEAYDIFKEGLGRDFYGQVLVTLQRAGGYARCGRGEPPQPGRRNFYVYTYDFRLDNVGAVRGLHQLIERIRAEHGDPRLAVDILAHSNGGLLARYYARYGDADLPASGPFAPTGAGAGSIRRLLLVGTPNLGTLQPVLSNIRGEEIGLRKIPQEVVATCTGAPQMMPHPSLPWLADVSGRTLDYDLFDIDTWRRLGWSVFDPRVAERTIARHGGGGRGRSYLAVLREYMAKHLARGRRFMEALSVPAPATEPPLYIFGGDCELTLARLVVENVGGQLHGRERVDDIAVPVAGVDYERLMFEPGDLVVTRSSLLGRRSLNVSAPRAEIESLQVAHSVFLCERHQRLTGNASFQDNLLNALLSVDEN
jgi:pimeloyl-ACP methyl ester carboxylesterase